MTLAYSSRMHGAKPMMKIYLLLTLVGLIVGLPYLPFSSRAKQPAPVQSDTAPA
jgi:hypothetical protein